MSYIPANIPITARLQYGRFAVKIRPHYRSFVPVPTRTHLRTHVLYTHTYLFTVLGAEVRVGAVVA